MLEFIVYAVLTCWALTFLGLTVGALVDQSGRQWRAAAPADPAAVFVAVLVGVPFALLALAAWIVS